MRCAEFRVRLDARLDAHRSPQADAELVAHARHCPKCCQWMNAHRELLQALDGLPQIEPGPDFAAQVLKRLELCQRRDKRRRTVLVSALAVAASLLIALGLPWRSLNWLSPGPAPGDSAVPATSVAALEDHYLKLAQTTQHLAKDITTPQIALAGNVVERFKPVTRSVYGALQNLWRTLPGSDVAQSLL